MRDHVDSVFADARVQRAFHFISDHECEIEADQIRLTEVSAPPFGEPARAEAFRHPLTYAVISSDRNFDFANLERWYERDAGERVGDYTLYRLKLRD